MLTRLTGLPIGLANRDFLFMKKKRSIFLFFSGDAISSENYVMLKKLFSSKLTYIFPITLYAYATLTKERYTNKHVDFVSMEYFYISYWHNSLIFLWRRMDSKIQLYINEGTNEIRMSCFRGKRVKPSFSPWGDIYEGSCQLKYRQQLVKDACNIYVLFYVKKTVTNYVHLRCMYFLKILSPQTRW